MLIDADLTRRILGAAIEVHRELGPGLLESAYQECLGWELRHREIVVEREVAVPLRYKQNIFLDCGYRIDLLVENRVVLEIKSVESLLPIHDAQLLTYMRIARKRVGLLLNFNVMALREGGIVRKVL